MINLRPGGAVPFAVTHANGDTSLPRTDGDGLVVLQRDVSAVVLQGYELLRFAFGAPRTDALSFDSDKSARQTYREALARANGQHDRALRAFLDAWLAGPKRRSAPGALKQLARALHGVCQSYAA